MPGSDRASAVSASRVRAALERGSFREASALCPATTRPYLLAALAERALRLELDTPGKPGLVCPESCGAHRDMNYDTMRAGIRAIRPFFAPMALAGSVDELRTLGIQAEEAMMRATGGVNTHRGAIFCLGLALNAAGRDVDVVDNQSNMKILLGKIAGEIFDIQLKDSSLQITPEPRGARRIALEGYKPLFEEWLPYAEKPLELLLRIMSTLDDTCVIKRVGAERAQQVKQEAREMADQVGHDAPVGPDGSPVTPDGSPVTPDLIGGLCKRYAAEGISPGGAADMLALTIFIHSIIS